MAEQFDLIERNNKSCFWRIRFGSLVAKETHDCVGHGIEVSVIIDDARRSDHLSRIFIAMDIPGAPRDTLSIQQFIPQRFVVTIFSSDFDIEFAFAKARLSNVPSTGPSFSKASTSIPRPGCFK